MSAGLDNAYSVFGGVLRTSMAIPELHPAPEGRPATWTLVVRQDERAPDTQLPALASEELADGESVSLHRASDGAARLTYTDTGTFDISASGRMIDWYRPSVVREDLARTDVLGRVLSLAAHADGLLMLHASAVAVGDRVIGFLAPKFYGKSTLACALTDAGARLVTDDALAVRAGHRVECAPGVPAIRLRSESAAHLRGASWPVADDSGDWRHLERRDVNEVAADWLPLDSLYLLQPRPSGEMGTAARREPMTGADAAMSLVRFAKLAGLLRGVLAVDYLGRATSIAGKVPVHVLHYARDLDRLGEVAEEITGWHRV